MKHYPGRSSVKLLQVAAVATAQTGTGRQVRAASADLVPPAEQDFRFYTALSASGGASSPTVQVLIEGSLDNTTWFPLVNGTVRTADGATSTEILDSSSALLPPYVRARTVLGGGTPPTSHTATVEILSNGDFTLE